MQTVRYGFVVLMLVALLGCSASRLPTPTVLRGTTMGTTWSVMLASPPNMTISEVHLAELRAGIDHQLDRIVDQMSTWKSDSDLSRYNRASAGTWIALEPEFMAVLGHALDLARDSDGAYDPTVGPLVNLWGFGPDGTRRAPPAPEQIETMRQRVGWHRITLDRPNTRVLQPGGIHLDLSAIAKGYAVDRVSDYLAAQGVVDSLVEIGGDLRARGHRVDGSAWRVALERPGSGAEEHALQSNQLVTGDATALLELSERGLATSGDYRHRFESGGREYSHHIDPRSGYPVDHAIASVSVVAATCAEADPLGTTLTVMGPDAGLRWASQRGIAAVFMIRDGHGYRRVMTPAFAATYGES